MNSVRRAISLIICFTLALTLFGCGSSDTDTGTGTETGIVNPELSGIDQIAEKTELSVGYVSGDSLNPYKAKSEINRELMYLLHAGLMSLSGNISAACFIAESYEFEGNQLTVNIKDDAVFSDGSDITSRNVVLSFEAAKDSPLYSQQLESVKSATAVSDKVVRFTLSGENIMAANLLTFPIISADSDNPKGAGKYYLAYNDDKQPYLKLNSHNEAYSISQNNQISLYDVSKGVNEQYAFMVHKTSVYIDTLDDFEYQRISSKTASVETTGLVFVGVNTESDNDMASWEWLRRVINIGLDRTAVSGAPLLGQSIPSSTPFHPSLYLLEGIEKIPSGGDKERAKVIMNENGFSAIGSSGYAYKGNLTLTLSLLVCSDNPLKVNLAEAFRDDMKKLGIRINIEKKSAEDYTKLLSDGKFQLYIGEIKLCDDFSLNEFFSKNGSVSYGIDAEFYDEYTAFREGKVNMGAYIEGFYTGVPFIPVCFLRSVMSYDSTLSGVAVSFYDPYSSVYSWTS